MKPDMNFKKVDKSTKLDGHQVVRIVDFEGDGEVSIHRGDQKGEVLWSHKSKGDSRTYGVGINAPEGLYVDVKGKAKVTLWPR